MAYFTSEYQISTVFHDAVSKAQPVGRGERLIPSTQCLLDHIWRIMSSLSLPSIGRMLINWRDLRGESSTWVTA